MEGIEMVDDEKGYIEIDKNDAVVQSCGWSLVREI
jgi:hypothetical protein